MCSCRSSIVHYAELNGGEDLTAREIEWCWVYQVLLSLKRLSTTIQHLEGARLGAFFADISERFDYRYSMGNDAIINQMRFWIATKKKHEASLVGDHTTNLIGFLEEETTRLRSMADKSVAADIPAAWTECPDDDEGAGSDDSQLGGQWDDQPNSVNWNFRKETEVQVGAMKITVPAGTPMKCTPSKEYQGGRVNWSDLMKRELLELYMDLAGR